MGWVSKKRSEGVQLPAFGRGWSAGYSEFRYGPKKRAPITLPKVFSDEKRKVMVEEVAELLRPARASNWEHEAETRHGLRQALVIKGNRWDVSDTEAADIVRRAFNHIGAGVERRPQGDEASGWGVVPQENCNWCYGELSSYQIATKQRFCCPEHARFGLERREYHDGWYRSEIGYAAYRVILRERNETRICEHETCRKPFKPIDLNSQQKYCCVECKHDSQRLIMPLRDCAYCGDAFQPTPRNPAQRYCSHEHSLLAKRTVPDRVCALPGCGQAFKPSHNNAKEGGKRGRYCCRECADKARSQTRHHRVCDCCGNSFTAAMPNARFCCEAHRQVVLKIQKGKPPKRLNTAIFDYHFARAA